MAVTLGEILKVVKPAKRTDRFKVLAGLYALSAQTNAVSSVDLKARLKREMGGDIPANLSLTLSRCTGLAEAVELGPPKLWRLTESGLKELQEISGLSLAGTRDSEHQADIGIICALEEPEFSAVQKAFGGKDAWRDIEVAGYPHIYRETALKTRKGTTLRVIGTTASAMGLTAAAIVTTQMIFRFRPRLIIMVGIAAGTHASGKQFGDVLVADPSVDYLSGKVVSDHGKREFLADPYPIGISPRIRSLLRRYDPNHQAFGRIRERWKAKSPGGQRKLFLGPMGAADQVVDDQSRVDEVLKHWRKLIGIEMETYAVYRACNEAPDPKPLFASFKAVCDFAANKGDSWQDYAAFMAANFSAEFILIEWESLWSTNNRKDL